MGITIHYETCFKGTKNQLTKKLNELAVIAKTIGFKENGPVYELDYATDFNTRDQFTPMVKNAETGKFEIDGSYRWAKIQAEVRAPIAWMKESSKERLKREREAEKIRARAEKMHGFTLSLWWGEGCEATNLAFVAFNGNGKSASRKWEGHGFTKTQFASDFVKAHVSVCTLLKKAEEMGLITNVSDEAEYYETEDITTLIDSGEENLKMIASFASMLKEKLGDNVVIVGGGVDVEEKLKDYDIGDTK